MTPQPDSGTQAATPEQNKLSAEISVTPTTPAHIAGRYELHGVLAKGGMGVVHTGWDHVANRMIAVKLLLDKAASPLAVKRFDYESHINAQLQHPSIPPVYDMGLHEGKPFLVMKLIKGRTLDDLIKNPDDKLNVLGIFESVAQAIGYAHSHSVIHRDLKPSNVMVGAFGEVQVMDWGLAKFRTDAEVTRPEASVASTFHDPRTADDSRTSAGSILGTPAYMPPEQAIGAIDKVNERSDVFGLGGILCAMLTGKPVFVGGDTETTRQLAAQGKVQDAFARLEASGAEPEVIALAKRCLAVEPSERPLDGYDVAKIAAKLRHEAEERAKQAEVDRAKAEVQVKEQAKRRRVWIGLAASLFVGTVASLGLAWWANESRKAATHAERLAEGRRVEADEQRTKAEEQTKLADEQRAKAEEQTKLSNAVKNFLQRDILQLTGSETQQQQVEGKTGSPSDATLTPKDLVLRAAMTIDGKFNDQPLFEAELRGSIGDTLRTMGQTSLAIPQYERMWELYTQHRGADHDDTLSSMIKLTNSYIRLSRHQDALKLKEEILALMKNKKEETLALMKSKPGDDHTDMLIKMHNLANGYAALGRHPEALKLHEETLALQKKNLGDDHPDTLGSMFNLANSYAALGRHPEALKMREETLALQKKKLGDDHPDTRWSMFNLASNYAELGRHLEALKLFEETLASRKKNLGDDHPGTLDSHWSVIGSLMALERRDEALPKIDELLQLAATAARNGKRPDPRLVPQMFTFRSEIMQQRKDAVGMRQTAEMWEALKPTDAGSLDDAACYRSLAAQFLSNQPEEAKAEADRAMKWLSLACAAGWKDRRHMELDTDLDALRDRVDFQKLVASLPKVTERAPPREKP